MATAAKPLIDPLTRQPFSGNIIPQSRIAPQAAFFLKYLPPPNNLVGATSYAVLSNNLLQHQIRGDIRIDQQFGATAVDGPLLDQRQRREGSQRFRLWAPSRCTAARRTPPSALTHVFSAALDQRRPRLVLPQHLPISARRCRGPISTSRPASRASTTPPRSSAFRRSPSTNYATFTGSPSDQRPKSNRIRNWQYADNVSYGRAATHRQDRRGIDAPDRRLLQRVRSVGIFNFVGTYTGNAFGDFLPGYPDSVTRDYFKELNGDWANFWSFYAQDNFRVTPNLTINIGVRFELNPFYTGIRGQKSAFDLSTGKLIIPSTIDPAVQPLTATMLQLFRDRFEYTKDLGLPDSIHRRGRIGRRASASPGGRWQRPNG